MSMTVAHNQWVAHIICRGSEGVQGGFNVFSRILIRSKPKPHRVLFSGMLGISYPPPTPNLCRARLLRSLGVGRLIQPRRFISFQSATMICSRVNMADPG